MTRSTPNIPDAADAGNYGRVRHYLTAGESFRHSTMAAYRVPSRGLGAALSDPGRLGGEDFFQWLEDCQNVAYVVWSYLTPVWWVRRDGVTYAAENVGGPTTAKHRNLARAWALVPKPEDRA